MKKNWIEELINNAISTGADYCDIFYEDTMIRKNILIDSKIDKIENQIINGVGIRLVSDDVTYYTSTNDLEKNNLLNLVNKLKRNINKQRVLDKVKLDHEIIKKLEIKKDNNNVNDKIKKEYLINIDKIARNYDSRIVQVEASFYEYNQNVNMGNTIGKYVNTSRSLTRLVVTVYAEDNNSKAESHYSIGLSNGYDFLDKIDLEKEIKEICETAVKKLTAKKAPGGMMPVIVGNGFGVLIHEAVGHSLEATTVSKGISVLSNKIGQKVASDIVTVIDDGTIENAWGSILIDDEGNITQKNICIENGILKGYLIDEVNSKKMKMKPTGSGRRENYHYIPTSRMTNTNLMSGENTIEEMIKSIDYGLYAKKMGGGSVDPTTGDFNFAVSEAYLIKNGEMKDMVKGASLIGNTLDVMQNIEMISNNLDADTGFCGSISGYVPVTCGQPTIKISSILVGGGSND